MLRFLHTSDWHLGRSFHGRPDALKHRLQQARLDVLRAIGDLAEQREAAFVLIAGDVFDANDADDRTVTQACAELHRIACPVFIIPGNHDCCDGPASVWRRACFNQEQPAHVTLLDTEQPLRLTEFGRPDVVLLPAPLLARTVTRDTTDHWTADTGRADTGRADTGQDGTHTPEPLYRIGIAHGGVIDFDFSRDDTAGPDAAHRTLAPDRAEQAGLDYLALGDWHSQQPVTARTWYSGAPEPLRYQERDSGHTLVVEIDAPGATPRVEAVRTAATRWLNHSAHLTDAADTDALDAWFTGLDAPTTAMVRLVLSGTLPLPELNRAEAMLARHGDRLLELRLRGDGLRVTLTDDDLDALAGDGYLRSAVRQLRAETDGDDDSASAAREAIRLLSRLG